MNKEANNKRDNDMDVIKSLNWRYSTKKFSDRKISDKDFDEIIEALRLSPSSYGLQPWKFIVVKNMEIRKKIKEAAWNQGQVTDASHLIVLCAKKEINEGYIDNYVSKTAEIRGVDMGTLSKFKEMLVSSVKSNKNLLDWNKHQVYLALGVLLSVCAFKKIDSCPMEGFDYSKVNDILGLDKKGLRVCALCAVGYRDESDKYSKIKKVRFNKKEVVEVI